MVHGLMAFEDLQEKIQNLHHLPSSSTSSSTISSSWVFFLFVFLQKLNNSIYTFSVFYHKLCMLIVFSCLNVWFCSNNLLSRVIVLHLYIGFPWRKKKLIIVFKMLMGCSYFSFYFNFSMLQGKFGHLDDYCSTFSF